MSKVIGVVCEGPTDYVAIRLIVDTVTQDKNEFLMLQPEESLAGHFGNGWKGVWKWCEDHAAIQGGKKRVPVYEELANNICRNWETVKGCCKQAQAFELAILEKLLS